MARVTLGRTKSKAKPLPRDGKKGNGAAVASLILGLLSLPFFIIFPLPVIGIFSGHAGVKNARNGRGGGAMAWIGLVLNYLGLILFALAAFGFYQLLNNPEFMAQYEAQFEAQTGQKLPQAASAAPKADPTQLTPEEQAQRHQALQPLETAKVWVSARLAKGDQLNQITHDFDLSVQEKSIWRQVSIVQGTIQATPLSSPEGKPMVLLPMQQGNGQIVWVCGGEVPGFAEDFCH